MSEGPILRLSRVLEERAIPLDPLLSVVNAVGVDNVFLGVGTISERVQILVPSRPEAMAIVAPAAKLPERSMLMVTALRNEPLGAALVIGGPTSAQQAIDEVGPAAGRGAWLSVVQSLAAAGGAIRNRTRYLSEERGTISVMFPPRSGNEESSFAFALAEAAMNVGAPASWRAVYTEAGMGAEIGVTTECTARGPSARLGLRFGPTSWDRAIDLAKALGSVDRARDAAVHMGMLASGLGVDELRGVEAEVDAAAPDLIVWLKIPR